MTLTSEQVNLTSHAITWSLRCNMLRLALSIGALFGQIAVVRSVAPTEGHEILNVFITSRTYRVKAARQLLGWSLSDLAGHIGVSTTTVWVFESGKPRPSVLNLDLVRIALESAGVIFVEENGEGPGVRLMKGAK